MRIALVQPQYDFEKYYADFTFYRAYEHLGIEYLASSLKEAGFEVLLLEGPALEMSNEEIIRRIYSFQPQIVGFTIDSYSLGISAELSRKIKQNIDGVHITVGGHLATLAAEEILKDYPYIDSAVIGYGEKVVVALAKAISSRRPLEEVNGLIYRVDNEIRTNPPKYTAIDIDGIPFPRREEVLEYRKNKGYFPCARVISSRGCPYYCSYCTTPPFVRVGDCSAWIPRTPENVVEEISELVERYGIKNVIFCDDNFIGPYLGIGIDRAKKIAQLIIENNLNVRFWMMCRVDSVVKGGHKLLSLLKKAGLWGIFLGLESGSDGQLKRYAKGTKVSENLKAVYIVKTENIMIESGFIMFDPYVNFCELRENAKFLHKTGEASIFRYFTNRLELYPGIKFISKLRKDGLLQDNYNYKSILGYKFKDGRIKLLSDFVASVGHELNFADEVIWNLKRLTCILNSALKKNIGSEKDEEMVVIIEKKLRKVESDIADINFNSFIEYLAIIENNLPSGAFGEENFPCIRNSLDEVKQRHIRSIEERISEIKEVLNYLRNLRINYNGEYFLNYFFAHLPNLGLID